MSSKQAKGVNMKFETTVKDILNVTHLVSEKHGFVSSKKSKEEGLPSTSSIVKEIIRYPDKAVSYQIDEMAHEKPFPQIVEDVYEWMLTLGTAPNPYLSKMFAIAYKQKVIGDFLSHYTIVPPSFTYEDKRDCKYSFGVLVSAISAYHREKQREVVLKEKADEAQSLHGTSDHFGNEKERLDLTNVKLIEVRHKKETFESQTEYFINTFKHGNNVITVFKNESLGNVGDEYDFKGTVIRHTEYQGVKQTVMNRLKIAQHREVK